MSLEGSQLGHYRLTRQIGSGGMGEIYLAEDIRIARQVAVKVVRNELTHYPDEAATQENARLFRREMKAVASLDNPHILTLLDFGEEIINRAAITYMVMPYRPEGSLNDWMSQRTEKLSLEEINNIIQQAADALQHAHDNGIIHQDVKPSNFLVRSKKDKPNQPDLLLADFGIAKMLSATATASQTSRGTAAFMPPEQWEGQPVAATDQYALAIMTYQLLTGRPPFQGRMEQVMHQHLMIQPQAPSKLNSQLSPAVDAVLLHALGKKPETRFASISDFAHAFQQALRYSDLRTTLTLNQTEALHGLTRSIMLPGKRQVTVSVPANVQNRQVIHVSGEGEAYYEGGVRGPLIITCAVSPNVSSSPSTPLETYRNTPLNAPTIAQTTVTAPTPKESTTPSHITGTIPAYSSSLASGTSASSGDNSQSLPSSKAKPRSRTKALMLVGLVLLLIASGLVSYGVYQNHVNAYPSYLPGQGTLAFYDPLTQPDQWNNYTNSDGSSSCQFSNNVYHIRETIVNFYSCNIATNFSNLAFEVQMTIVQGDCGGILFRGNFVISEYYYYEICQDRAYALLKYVNNQTSGSVKLKGGINTQIRTGLNLSNKIGVVANGNKIIMYVNEQEIDSIQDDSYSQGQLGLFAKSSSSTTEVSFSNARVWTL